MRIANIISQILLGIVFIFSGFVKAVDPLGSVYKFNDYFAAFGTPWMEPFSMFFAVMLCALEFIIGFAILFGLKMRLSAWGGLLFMAFFTPLTLYIAIANPVSDCGCFGDALIMTNNETFIKNLFLLAAAVVIFIYRKRFKSLLSDKLQWLLLLLSVVFIALIMIYSLRHLPIIDFRPWKVGNKISELVTPTPEVAEVFLIYRNKNTGETKEYPVNNYPWNDSEWVANWEFVEQKKNVIQPFKPAPINDFIIVDEYGDNLTEYFFDNPDFQFMLFAYDLNKTSRKNFNKINALAEAAENEGFSFIGLTASPFSLIDSFRHEVQAMHPYFLVDEIALKTAIRANPGIILIKNGEVLAKWHHNDTPTFEKVKEKYLK